MFDYPADSSNVPGQVLLGSALQLSAQPYDSADQAISGLTLAWSSSDSTVLAVSSTGEVTGRGLGNVIITTSARGKEAALPFVVSPHVASIELLPPSLGLVPGGTADLTFALRDSLGNPVEPRVLTITAEDEGVARAAQQFGGLSVHAGGPGYRRSPSRAKARQLSSM